MEKILKTEHQKLSSYKDEFHLIKQFVDEIEGDRVLAINPREGELLSKYTASGATIDSFVSDDEWVDAAKTFSKNVYFGYSHTPLLAIDDDIYDVLFVCEDFALVDDVDRMASQYHRILKNGGVLLCGVWNLRWWGYIEAIVSGGGHADFNDPLHGRFSILIDTLRARLERLGFSSMEMMIFAPPAEKRHKLEQYAEISKHMEMPLNADRFSHKIYFVQARK
jgi:SAM-dependent methyltransferase